MRAHILAASCIIIWFVLLFGAIASKTFATIVGAIIVIGFAGSIIAIVYFVLLGAFRGGDYYG